MSKLDSYTSHNFSAVNEQIKQISKRERARTFSYWLLSLRTIFIYAAAVAFIVILLMLSFSWAYRIINAPYVTEKTEVVRPEIIEREVLKVVQVPVEKSILENSSSSYEGPTNTVATSSSSSSQVPAASIVTNYNMFKNANVPQFADYGFTEVTTGWKYTDSESNYPEYQYCYIQKVGIGRTAKLRADIAEISKEGEYISNIDSRLAIELSVPQDALNQAEGYCQWASAD